jgi:hypothetical protein
MRYIIYIVCKMKRLFLLLIFITELSISCFAQDSTLHERFIATLLNEYEMPGRWIFVEIDSCNSKKDYEVINPIAIFRYYSESYLEVDKAFFMWNAFQTLKQHEQFGYCPESVAIYGKRKYYVKGAKVNMRKYYEFMKQPITEILLKYFDKNSKLKKQYIKFLYELIAVCYTNNIKVISFGESDAVFKVFK